MRIEINILTPCEADIYIGSDAKQLSTILQRGRERFAAEVDAIECKARR